MKFCQQLTRLFSRGKICVANFIPHKNRLSKTALAAKGANFFQSLLCPKHSRTPWSCGLSRQPWIGRSKDRIPSPPTFLLKWMTLTREERKKTEKYKCVNDVAGYHCKA